MPLAASFSRKAAVSSFRSGRQAHCIWLRVKIWMASAPMARPLPGALNTPPVMGTWAPRCIAVPGPSSGAQGNAMGPDLEEERAVLLRDVVEQDLVGGAGEAGAEAPAPDRALETAGLVVHGQGRVPHGLLGPVIEDDGGRPRRLV